jgi:hypothetical protein
MYRKETCRREFNRIATTVILGAVLAACTPEGQAQETRPAVTQTIDGLDIPGESEEAIVETITATNTPEATATPENTPTVTATATPENTATPEATATAKAPEFPSEISEFFGPGGIDKNNLAAIDYGEGYINKSWRIYIRPKDLHLDAPTITLGDGRYHVQGWADAWFREIDGTAHHITVPLIIFDTETYDMWSIMGPVQSLSPKDDLDREIFTRHFTGPFDESTYATYWLDTVMCFKANGDRDCNNEYNQSPYNINVGYIPPADFDTEKYRGILQPNVEFLRTILEEVYTKDNVEAFWQTFDPSLLELNEPNLPANFIIPLIVS